MLVAAPGTFVVLAVTALVTFTAIADHVVTVTGDLHRDLW